MLSNSKKVLSLTEMSNVRGGGKNNGKNKRHWGGVEGGAGGDDGSGYAAKGLGGVEGGAGGDDGSGY